MLTDMVKQAVWRIIFFGFFLTLMTDASAEKDDDYIFSRVDYQTGLSHSAVLSIYQDNSGLMWLGTYDGVNCYDGKAIEVFRSDTSTDFTLSNNVIHSICQAPGGHLWLNTHLGLDLFCPEMRQVREVFSFGSREYSIHSNRRGDTWVICEDKVRYYNTLHHKFCTASPEVPATDFSGNRAFVTDNGELWHLPSGTGNINIYSVSSFSSDSTEVRTCSFTMDFHSGTVSEMFYHNGLICFVDDSGGLYVYDITRKSKIYIRNISDLLNKYGAIGGIVPFYEDVIIGFRTNGLVRLRMSENYAVEEIDRNIRIYGLYSDSTQGILWIATDGQGAMLYSKEVSIAANLMLSSLSPNLARPVRSIMADSSGGLWFGTKGDGIVNVPGFFWGGGSLDKEGYTVFVPNESISVSEYERRSREFQVYTMRQSHFHDGFWAGTGIDGLYWFSYKDRSLSHVRSETPEKVSEIHGIYEADDGILYVTTADSGFYRLAVEEKSGHPVISENKRYSFYHKGHRIDMFYPILPDGDSLLWLGSRGSGLVRFDLRTEEYQVISLNEKLGKAVDDILSLCKTRDGSIYVGTTSGLVRIGFDMGKMSFSYIGKEHGFLNDMIHGVLEDADGFLWLGTNRGLVKYNPATGLSHTYYYSSGVSVGEFCDDAYYRNPYDGALFFGGVDGLLCLPPGLSSVQEASPEIVLREVSLNWKRVRLSDCTCIEDGNKALYFEAPLESFSVSFAVPDYINGKDVEYSYILEGFSDNWSVFGSGGEASFNSVPPGEYELKVRYKKDVFDMEYKSFSIPVIITSPWYISRNAKIVYFLLLASALIFLAFYARRIIRRRMALRAGVVPASVPMIYDRMSIFYACCDRLMSENIQYKDRKRNVELIREEMSGMFPWLTMSLLPSWIPVFRVFAEQDIYSAVKSVLDSLEAENTDISKIGISVHKGLSWPVYLNAFRIVLYCCFRHLSLKGSNAEMSVFESSGSLCVEFRSDRSALESLSSLAAGIEGVGVGLYVKDDMVGLWKSVLQAAFARPEVNTVCQDNVFRVEFGKIENKVKDTPSGKTVIFLTSSAEMAWLVSDMLSDDFSVTTVSRDEDAFEMIRLMPVSLLMADMRMYAGKEGTLVRQLRENAAYMDGTAFVPIFAPVSDRTIYNEFVRISDMYIAMPYDIPILSSIVYKAVYGKSDISEGYIDGRIYTDVLKNWGITLCCNNSEDMEFVRKVIDLIKSGLGNEDLGTPFLADRMSMSESRFYRYFKRVFNMPPDSLIKTLRLERAAVMLKNGSSIMDVLCEIGISSRSYFYKEFAGRFGMTPKNFREKN